MTWSDRNLANTVEARPVYHTIPCELPRPKIDPLYHQLAREETDPDERRRLLFDFAHRWDDGASGFEGGRCTQCGKLRKDVRIRINPKTGEPVRLASSIAREISKTRDVPRIVFINRPPE